AGDLSGDLVGVRREDRYLYISPAPGRRAAARSPRREHKLVTAAAPALDQLHQRASTRRAELDHSGRFRDPDRAGTSTRLYHLAQFGERRSVFALSGSSREGAGMLSRVRSALGQLWVPLSVCVLIAGWQSMIAARPATIDPQYGQFSMSG